MQKVKLKKPKRRFKNENEILEYRIETLKAKRKNNPLDERECVKKTVQWLKNKYGNSIYIFIDQDTGSARTKSGWDFLISLEKKIIFVEAKMENKPLSDFQKLTRENIIASGGWYLILRFFIDDDKMIFGIILDDPNLKTDSIIGKPIETLVLKDFGL